MNNADIGLGNEKAIDQLIAHHSIVFEPKKGWYGFPLALAAGGICMLRSE